MEQQLIIISREDLQQLIKLSVLEALEERAKHASIVPAGPMNAKEAAAYVKTPLPTLYQYVSKRLIPHYKPGKALLFYQEELDEWVRIHRCKTRAQIEREGFDFSESKPKRLKKKNNR